MSFAESVLGPALIEIIPAVAVAGIPFSSAGVALNTVSVSEGR